MGVYFEYEADFLEYVVSLRIYEIEKVNNSQYKDIMNITETLDAEFTGLQLNKFTKSSLFDSSEERYSKLRRTISNITICQIGLSAYLKDSSAENKYVAHTYNFHLYPPVFGPVDVRFTCQASSLKFLCKYKFDFNKFIYDGISFMNEEQEQQISAFLDRKELFQGLEREVDESAIQRLCSIVAEWMYGSQADRPLQISKEDDDFAVIQDYILHNELRTRFSDVWTIIDKDKITVEKVGKEVREQKELEESQSKQEKSTSLRDSLLGFTRIFRLLVQAQKPILGHNMFMDLLLYYDKFHKPLPKSYKEIKAELHRIFPVIIDTKHITNTVRKSMENTGLIENTALSLLFKSLHSQKGQQYVIHSPSIHLGPGCETYEQEELPHEAGFDAYMCGYVFLRIAHIITFKDVPSSNVVPCTFRKYLNSNSQYINKVNVIRANINYINIDGDDPESQRPDLIYVRSREKSYRLEVNKIAKWFSPYGSVDIRLQGKTSALVATSNFGCAKDILQKFKRHDKIYVTKYSVWRHSPAVRNVLLAGTLVSGGLCVLALWSSRKQST